MIIGIDLGTTNSLAACYSENGPFIIPNRLGHTLTPSAVSVDADGYVYIGEAALKRKLLYPDTVAEVFKRDMGTGREYRLSGKNFYAEDLSALILRSLKEDAEAYLGRPVEEAVISVPAYFNDIRRRAAIRAGELAGLKVERLISEPTAAAVAYGLYERRDNARFLVFDLGGGTFDVSVLERFENILEVRAVAGDNYLGGEDFTAVLERRLLKENRLAEETLSRKERALLHETMEQCKKSLSQNSCSEAAVQLKGRPVRFRITQEEYGQALEPLLDRIRRPIQKSLSDSGLRVSDVDAVVLAGGATRLPIVRSFISRLFHRFPDTGIHPEEAIALGAAVHAAMKERRGFVREIILTDVCPFTLGTNVLHRDERTGELIPGYFCPIIERNTVIPVSRTERFYTAADYQTEFLVHILQGESRYASNNISLGSLCVTVPGKKAGEEGIDVTFTYDINSILEAEVTILSTGEKKRQIIKGAGTALSDGEIEARMKDLAYLKIPPRDQKENRLLLLKCERLYEESTGSARHAIEQQLEHFESVLNAGGPQEVKEARERLLEKIRVWEERDGDLM